LKINLLGWLVLGLILIFLTSACGAPGANLPAPATDQVTSATTVAPPESTAAPSALEPAEDVSTEYVPSETPMSSPEPMRTEVVKTPDARPIAKPKGIAPGQPMVDMEVVPGEILSEKETTRPGPSEEQQQLLASLESQGAAPDFLSNDVWLNSEPLRLADLRGKVVLVEFWTFG
jgi:pyruvate/2-oxoglutarate dehydrogenase complex dihydrolipoamide acyltransferase (E2) component